MSNPRLSKSRLLYLRQCPLRLWHEIHNRESANPLDEATQHRFSEGTRIGELAQQRYPGGVLVDAPYWDSANAQQHTSALLQSDVPTIYEAAFEASRTRIRVDIMLRKGSGSWEVWEVKAVGTPKEIHFIDLALQIRIIREWSDESNLPLRISRCGILHLNTAYTYNGEDYDLAALFQEHDCTDMISEYGDEVEELIQAGRSLLDSNDPPETEPGTHCSDPYLCPFSGSLCELPPIDELCLLPGVGQKTAQRLRAKGVDTIAEAIQQPQIFNGLQQRALRSLQLGKPVIETGLDTVLKEIGFPRHYLDFESTGSMLVLPRYAQTHPFQALPFQFSLHTEHEPGGKLTHQGYLHSSDDDPREPLTEKLLNALESTPGRIVVYSSYEKTVLNALKRYLPQYADRLEAVIERLVDLLPVVKSYVYHPDFKGSFSIKDVLPALVPGEGYGELAIQDGDTASLRYLQMLGVITAGEQDKDIHSSEANAESIHTSLWEYCRQDTLAMVDLVHMLETGR